MEKTGVGLGPGTFGATASTFVRSGLSSVAAPTENGKYIALPKPYAKNNFETEKVTSSARSPSTPCPNPREVASMSLWRCTAPFGWPPLPAVYRKNAVSYGEGGAAARELETASIRSVHFGQRAPPGSACSSPTI